MGYHLREIEKGVLGEFSKIKEEFEELEDAFLQKDNILILCELSDLVGAIDLFVNKNYNLQISDVLAFANKTKESFKEGKR